MLEVNDDMEELLRRAAKDYPLNSGAANFDKVLQGLKAEQDHENETEEKRGGKKRRFLWLLLLLPMGLICNRYYNGFSDKVTAENIDSKSDIIDTAGKEFYQHQISKTNQEREKELQRKSGQMAKAKPAAENTEFVKGDNSTDNKARDAIERNYQNSSTAKMLNRPYAKGVGNKSSSIDKQGKKTANQLFNQNIAGINESGIKTNAKAELKELQVKELETDDPQLREVYLDEQKHLALSRQPTETTPDSVLEKEVAAKPDKNPRVKHLYAGIVGGPELSVVKFSSLSKPGYNVGALIGYQVSKHISIETGLQWAKKNYKSDGQYFNTSKLPIPSYVKIISLEGYCQMLELPVGLKYNFKTRRSKIWFATAGVSTYFMQNEDYDYEYLSYGQVNSRYVAYKNSANNWASVLNISAGFTRKMQKNSMLRVEPFIKIPLQGIGIGSLPISGSGISLGYVRMLF